MNNLSTERLAELFVEVADTLVDEFDVIEYLAMVTTHTADISQADAAGLLLVDAEGRLQFMAASLESAKLLELFQVQNAEGPCQDCFREGSPVMDTDLSAATTRWPLFAPRAVAAGFHSVHAFPLRHRGRVIGALNLFSSAVGHVPAVDERVIQALADLATIGLLQERAIHHGEILTEQLQLALNSRISIEQAKGALAQLHAVDVDVAFDMLRGYSRRGHHRLVDVAHAVLADPTSHPELTTPTTDSHGP